MDDDALALLQERLGVRFKNPATLRHALTHRSAAADNTLESNERLEFLGDSVVGLVISENLFRLYPDSSEGDLAKSKSYVVSETSLAEAAQELGLEAFLVLSAGEAASGGRRRRSILADAFEAIIAAVYLDAGIRAARRIVRQLLLPTLKRTIADEHRGDFKSSLQEQVQASARCTPVYRIVSEEGRDHEKVFTAQALAGATVIGIGAGRSKKEAEQAAALNALENLPPDLPELLAETPDELPAGVQ